jgi:hypothetical protein
MATYGQTVTVTQIDQITSRSATAGTTTGTLVVPTNAEAEVFVGCFIGGSTVGTATASFTSPNYGSIVSVSDNTGASLNDKRNLVLGPGTYTLTAFLQTGSSGAASVRIVGSLRTYS